MTPHRLLALGGTRSGKSRYAQGTDPVVLVSDEVALGRRPRLVGRWRPGR